jgi:hypothetical protein
MKLWLDDERPAPKGWVLAKTANEAIRHLENMRKAPEKPDVLYGYRLDPKDRWREKSVYTQEFFEITEMSLDHDLADVHYDYFHAGQALSKDHPARALAREQSAKELTGYDVLLWMVEHEVWPTEACYVHTHNSARAFGMVGLINRYGPYDQWTRWTPYQPPRAKS